MKILGTYRITYENGVSQEKNLIAHSDYEEIIKPKLMAIHSIECLKVKSREEKAENKRRIEKIKGEITAMFGENWFTDKSPLWKAHDTGILSLPDIQGGDSKCEVEKI